MANNSVKATLKMLKENSSLDSKAQALTSLRRLLLEDQRVMKALSDEDFCELCNPVINVAIMDNASEKLHIEACRTLDIILPETKHKNFDFFQSILQINRKKRLKILLSLSILKDETVAIIASKLSTLSFLSNCMESIQPTVMTWLLPENAANIPIIKNADNRALNENEEFEERVVERALEFLCRLCGLSSSGLSIKQFDVLIMERVVPLVYMGNRKQRVPALAVLQKATKNDIGTRVRSFNKQIWEKFKDSLQNVYCKRMTLLVNEYSLDWAQLWEISISLIGTDLHKGSALVNSLLKVEELAFKSGDPNRRQAFLSWKFLIDNFALDPHELATKRRLKLLCVPLNAKNSKTELMVLTKLEVWWHLIYKIYPSLAGFTDEVLVPFLTLCFGPFGEKPLFVQGNDSNVSLGKKYYKTQIFSIGALAQLIVSAEDRSKILISVIDEKLPDSVNNAIFEKNFKIFIHSFGESIISLGLLSDDSVKNKFELCKIMWNSLIKRIEGYDKMKILMYKEVTSVLGELIRNQFHNIPMIKEFLINIVLKSFDNIAQSAKFTENILLELAKISIQVDNFSHYTNDHFKSLETLLRCLVKPSDADVYYPETLELMQMIRSTIEEASKNESNKRAVREIWCILARIAKMYIEDSQNINEGTSLECNFKTIDSIVAFPFTYLITDDLLQMMMIAEAWCSLYKQYDFQAELIVTVKPNEILEKTSKMIISALENNNKCCHLVTVCIDGLLSVVNYGSLPSGKEIPNFVHLLKNLTLLCLRNDSFVTDKVLKSLSSFLLSVFSHSSEKCAIYLKSIEPAVRVMLTKVDNKDFGNEILNTCTTIVKLFKQALQNGSTDEKSKKLLEELIKEIDRASNKNIDVSTPKSKKKAITTIGILSKKTSSPSTRTPGKENFAKPKQVNIVEPDSQDFVVINSEPKHDVSRMTEHQKEKLKRRNDDIPAMYNELTVSNSQDSQQLQHWFDAKTKTLPASQKKEAAISNIEQQASKGASPSTFKNITQALSNDQRKASSSASTSKDNEKPATVVTKLRESPRRSSNVNSSSNVAANKREAEIAAAPNVAKKLDFEGRDDDEQTSPSIIEGKMRRTGNNPPAEESSATAQGATEKVQTLRKTLKKCNSTEQLATRAGRKRRNSETSSSSDGSLNIERVKKPRVTESLEVCNSLDSNKSEDSGSKSSTDENISKRQRRESSRLKIDMVFDPVPNRRSVSKSAQDAKEENKVASPVKDKGGSSPSKPSKGKGAVAMEPAKVDTNQQQQKTSLKVTRRSLKLFENVSETVVEKTDASKQRDKNSRKSLPGKVETGIYKKKNEPPAMQTQTQTTTQESFIIEDVSTQVESSAERSEPSVAAKPAASERAESAAASAKATQDPDIVESSQEPSLKYGKSSECVIKIKKVEHLNRPITVEQVPAAAGATEKEADKAMEIIDETVADPTEDKSVSVIQATVDAEKAAPAAQAEAKKADANGGGKTPTTAATATTNHTQSPKSSTPQTFKKSFTLGGRAAWMVNLATKQSFGGSPSAEIPKCDFNLTDEVTIVPLKKDSKRESERVASPLSNRQTKIFNNMNNLKMPERSSSPSMAMFCNLKNDGERISPKLEKHMQEKESEAGNAEKEVLHNNNNNDETSDSSDDSSPKKRELPILEWSNANPPSLTASPSVSILKRIQEYEVETPGGKKKRVSFADPPVSREMGYEIMTDASSPVRLEKLPTSRSPSALCIARRSKRRIERENEFSIEEKSMTKTHGSAPSSPKVKLLNKLESLEEMPTPTVSRQQQQQQVSNTQDDMFEEINAPTTSKSSNNEHLVMAKTSSQNEPNDSSIKLDSINISNIQKSDVTQSNSLEDTVDINNLSTSLNSTRDVTMDHAKAYFSQPSSRDQTDTLPVTDSVFSNPGLTQESQSSVAQLNKPETLDSTQPVYPSLTSCSEAVDSICAQLVDPMFVDDLTQHFLSKSIHKVGDLAQLTEVEVNRLPIIAPKVTNVRKVLAKYEEDLRAKTPQKKMKTPCVSSSTPLERKRTERNKLVNDSFDEPFVNKTISSDSDSSVSDGCKRRVLRSPKRPSADNSMQTSPVKRLKKDDEKACAELMAQCDDDFLLNEICKRFDFEQILQAYNINSSDLISILAKNLALEKEKGINGLIFEPTDMRVVLESATNDLILEQVKSRDEVKSSQDLLDVALRNNVDKLSKDTKKRIFETIASRLDPCEFVDMCSDVVKKELRKGQKK